MRKNSPSSAPLAGSVAAIYLDLYHSAWILFITGILGALFWILVFNDILHLPMESYANTIFLSVIGVLFAFFLLQSLLTFFKLFSLKKEVRKEKQELQRLKTYFFEEFTAQKIDACIELSTEDSAEDAYFLRYQFMKDALDKQTPQISDACKESLLEFFYQKIFSTT